jgi:glycosyltransferase involved in cell wall biosynthesis
MKIGLITPGFSADETDWCIPAILDLARKLAESHEVHVFTLRYPHVRKRYVVYGVTVHAFGGATIGGLWRIPLTLRVVNSLRQESTKKPFDILHALWGDEPGLIAVIAQKLLGTATVVSLLGGELIEANDIGYGHQLSRSARWMIRQSLNFANCVTVGSQTLYLRATHYVNDAKLVKVPLGVDVELFQPQVNESQESFKALHVASLTPVKNQIMLLRAFDMARRKIPKMQLDLVGDGARRDELENIAHDLQLDDVVHFHGEIMHDQLPAYYHTADLCVLTSIYESQSMVTLEAGACGRATVGTKVGILPELLPDEFLVQPDDVDGLARIIIRLASDRELLEKLSQGVYERVQADYALNQSIDRWLEIYQNAANH